MKEYRKQGLRRVKTEKQDSIAISNYGIDHWFRLINYETNEGNYEELKLLGRQYRHYMTMRIKSVLELTHLLDYTMPRIKTVLGGWSERNGKDKLCDFVDEYWHYDNITSYAEEEFIGSCIFGAKSKGYHQSRSKATKIHSLAKEGIPPTIFRYAIGKNACKGSCSGIKRSKSYPYDNFNTDESNCLCRN